MLIFPSIFPKTILSPRRRVPASFLFPKALSGKMITVSQRHHSPFVDQDLSFSRWIPCLGQMLVGQLCFVTSELALPFSTFPPSPGCPFSPSHYLRSRQVYCWPVPNPFFTRGILDSFSPVPLLRRRLLLLFDRSFPFPDPLQTLSSFFFSAILLLSLIESPWYPPSSPLGSRVVHLPYWSPAVCFLFLFSGLPEVPSFSP